jgi:hypothetical protein
VRQRCFLKGERDELNRHVSVLCDGHASRMLSFVVEPPAEERGWTALCRHVLVRDMWVVSPDVGLSMAEYASEQKFVLDALYLYLSFVGRVFDRSVQTATLNSFPWWTVLYHSLHRYNSDFMRHRPFVLCHFDCSVDRVAPRVRVERMSVYIQRCLQSGIPVLPLLDIVSGFCGSRNAVARAIVSRVVFNSSDSEFVDGGVAKIIGASDYSDAELLEDAQEYMGVCPMSDTFLGVKAHASFLSERGVNIVSELVHRERTLRNPAWEYCVRTPTCDWYDPAQGAVHAAVPRDGFSACLLVEPSLAEGLRQVAGFVFSSCAAGAPAAAPTRRTCVSTRVQTLYPPAARAERSLVVCSASLVDSVCRTLREFRPFVQIQKITKKNTALDAKSSVVVISSAALRGEQLSGSNCSILVREKDYELGEDVCLGAEDDMFGESEAALVVQRGGAAALVCRAGGWSVSASLEADRGESSVLVRLDPGAGACAVLRVESRVYRLTAAGARKMRDALGRSHCSVLWHWWRHAIVHESCFSSRSDAALAGVLGALRARFSLGVCRSGMGSATTRLLMGAIHADGMLDGDVRNRSHEQNLKRSYMRFVCVGLPARAEEAAGAFRVSAVGEAADPACLAEYGECEARVMELLRTALGADRGEALRRALGEHVATESFVAMVSEVMCAGGEAAVRAALEGVVRDSEADAAVEILAAAPAPSDRDQDRFEYHHRMLRRVLCGDATRARVLRRPGESGVARVGLGDTLRMQASGDVVCAVCLEDGEAVVRPMLINPGGCEHVCCEACLRDLRRMRGPMSSHCPVCRSEIASVAELVLQAEGERGAKRMQLEMCGALQSALDRLLEAGCASILCLTVGSADQARTESRVRSCDRVRACAGLLSASPSTSLPSVHVCSMKQCSEYVGAARFDGMLLTCATVRAREIARALLVRSAPVCVCYVSGTMDEHYSAEVCQWIESGRRPDLSAVYSKCLSRRAQSE